MDLDLGSNGSECEVVGWSRKAPQTTQARSNMEKVTHTQRVMLLMMVMMSVQEEAGGIGGDDDDDMKSTMPSVLCRANLSIE